MYTEIVATAAAAISCIAIVVSVVTALRVNRRGRRVERLLSQADRNTAYEARLADWPEALRFYGIDPDALKPEDPSPRQIAYLVLSVNALTAKCDLMEIEVCEYLQMKEADYYRFMFSHRETRRAWDFAKRCISSRWSEDISDYLDRWKLKGAGQPQPATDDGPQGPAPQAAR